MTSQPPPYIDGQIVNGHRYVAASNTWEPVTAEQMAAVGPAPKKKGKAKWIVGGVVALFLIAGIANAAGGNKDSSNPATDATTPIAAATSDSSTPAPTDTSAPTQSAAPADGTVSQQQALISAQSYLSMGSGFSAYGLLQQLTSSAGEGFSVADAKWAIAHANPDWNQQAVDSAKSYLALGGFSRASLLRQLTSKAGAGFTQAQALFALRAVGL